MLNVHLRITDAATGSTDSRCGCASSGRTASRTSRRSAAPRRFPAGATRTSAGTSRLGRERWWYIDGACEIPLPAGVPLRVQATKGPEYVPLDETVTLGAGQIALRFALSRWTDTRADGWVSVDTRCHFLTPHAALLEAQAEGLDVVNLLATPFPVLALDANTYTTTPNLLAFSGQAARPRTRRLLGRREHAQHAPGAREGRASELAPAGVPAHVRRRGNRRLGRVRLVRPVPPQEGADGVGGRVRAGGRA